jgi:hypothetical protein
VITSHPIQISSWPGKSNSNAFLSVLGESLAQQGVELIAVDSPSKVLTHHARALLVQWPDQIFWRRKRPAPYTEAVREICGIWKWKRAGKKIIWIVHNDIPHDFDRQQLRLWKYYTNFLSRLADGYMTLSPATRAAVVSTFPHLAAKPFSTFRHPAYPLRCPSEGEVLAYRKRFDLPQDGLLIGCLGQIGAYKGVSELVHAIREIADSRLRLFIQGRPRKNFSGRDFLNLVGGDRRITVNFDRVSDEEYSLALVACDKLVAPYVRYLHSGTLVHYLSAGKCILTPMTPFAADLEDCVGEGWLSLYEGLISSAVLRRFVDLGAPPRRPQLDLFSGRQAATAIIDFVLELESI